MIKYRSDIDGLRALAIISVLVFHMFPKLLPGGYVGVDIFFIISGYLIGSTIFNEYEKGKFSFLNFYQRRLLRIIPLLLIVLFATFLLGYFYLLPHEFKSLGRHIGAASVFGSNFQLLKERGYFDTASELKPLLHLWSLGIEEQFYLFLPILILFINKIWKRPIIVISLLASISLIYSYYLTINNLEAAFFRPESRFWELLIGVLLSRLEKIPSAILEKQKPYISILGMVLCLIAIFSYNNETPFPGFYALVPTLGAALLIYSGEKGLINNKIFKLSSLVFVGKISYSLYLWHWVLLSFNQILYQQNPPQHLIYILVIISILLSIITFYFIEKPLKHLSVFQKKMISITTIILLILSYNLGRSVFHLKITQSNLPKEVRDISLKALDINDMDGTEMIPFENWFYNKIGNGPDTIIVLGDSHTGMYYSRISKYLKNKNSPYTVYFFIKPGCIPITNLSYKQHGKQICNNYYEKAYQFGLEHKAKKLIIASNLLPHLNGEMDSYFTHNQTEVKINNSKTVYNLILDNFSRHLESYNNKNIKIFYISSIPFGSEFNPNKMFKRSFSLNPFKIDIKNFDLKHFKEKYDHIIQDLKNVASKNNATIIDPINYLCQNNQCQTVDENNLPIYCDDNHFNKNYVSNRITYLDFIFQ